MVQGPRTVGLSVCLCGERRKTFLFCTGDVGLHEKELRVMSTKQRIPMAVLGATGMVGQRFIELLQGHPWFELVGLGASEQHRRQPYGQVARWRLLGEMPASVAALPVLPCQPDEFPGVKVVFSALPAEAATLTPGNSS